MQIIDRKVNESIVIGDQGEDVITILEINSEYVRIGIESPCSVPAYRIETLFVESPADEEMVPDELELAAR